MSDSHITGHHAELLAGLEHPAERAAGPRTAELQDDATRMSKRADLKLVKLPQGVKTIVPLRSVGTTNGRGQPALTATPLTHFVRRIDVVALPHDFGSTTNPAVGLVRACGVAALASWEKPNHPLQ